MKNKIPRHIYTVVDLAVIGSLYLLVPIALVYWLGLYRGVLTAFTAWFLKQFITRTLLGLDPLTTVDEFFLLDWEKNRANIITLMKISKVTDYDKFRDFLIQKVTSTKRTRSKLVKICSEYYFKEIQDASEW